MSSSSKTAPQNASIREWWFRLIGRHDDGTKHNWNYAGAVTEDHACDWDYCHCYREQCLDCKKTRVQAAGGFEIR